MHPAGTAFPAALQVVCAVCEAAQPPATLCAECGLPLKLPPGVRPVADPVIEQLPGLEPTLQEPASDAQVGLLPGLEPTSDPAGEVEPLYVEGLEPTADVLLDLPGEDPPLPGLDPTGDAFNRTTPAPIAIPVVCPYCQHVQAQGRICDGCGRSKQRLLSAASAPEADFAEDVDVRCRSCGARVLHRRLCSECGQPLPPPEA